MVKYVVEQIIVDFITDMQKIESPFVREMINGQYILTNKITEGYDWVFNDETVLATEKLDGTNVSVIIEDGQVKAIYNRTERLPFFNKGKQHIILGVMESYGRGYLDLLEDGQHFGELIGVKLQGNPYQIEGHLWVPFETYAREHLRYTSWGKYPKTFDAISEWFEKDLFSLFMRRTKKVVVPPEGIVFVQPATGKMAKLRRDMFSWWKGIRHKEEEKEEEEQLAFTSVRI